MPAQPNMVTNPLLTWLLSPIVGQLDRIEQKLDALNRKADRIMTAVQIQQESLDEYAQAVSDVADEIASDIEVLKQAAANQEPLPQANVDSLSASLDKLKGLDQPDTEALPE
jgi:ABC-type transporter Mla subunit MlaD